MPTLRRSIVAVAGFGLILAAGTEAALGEDLGKKACAAEARKLCPAEMASWSRKKVEACMIAKINQTSPTCHAAMLRIKAERLAAAAKKP